MGSGTGIGVPAFLVGHNNAKPINASEGGHLQVVSSFPKVKNLGRIQVRTTAAVTLPDCPCSSIIIRAKEGNRGNIWIGGIDDDTPQVNIGMPLHEDESIILYLDNTNKVKLIASMDYDEVYVLAYLDNDVDANVTPGNPAPPDLTAPTVTSRFPANGATNVATNTAIYAIFSEEILNSTITNANITISPSVTKTVTKDSIDKTKVLVIPSANLAFSTPYTVTFGTGLTDMAEVPNALAGAVSWTFTTTNAPPPPDTTPPTIVSVTPANNATNVVVGVTPTVSFSEDLLNSSVNSTSITLTKVSNNQTLTTSYTHSTDGKTITVTPSAALENSTQYRLRIKGGATSGVKDNASNALAADADYIFTTEAPAIQAVYSVSGNDYFEMHENDYIKVGAYINGDSSILKNGKPFTKFVFTLKKQGSPSSSTISFDITDKNGSVKQVLGTTNITSLSSTQDTEVTFNITGYTFAKNDMVTISYDDGDSDNCLLVKYSNTNVTSDGSATCLRKYQTPFFFFGGWTTDTSSDMSGVFYSQG